MFTAERKTVLRERYFSHIGNDVMGGVMAAIVALPLALAFGEASGLGAAAGLYGAIACGVFASLFGGTKGQVSGPTGPMTVVTAAAYASQPDHPEWVFLGVFLAGVIQMLMGWAKVGQYVHYMPYPVISGFMTGIGVIIISLQLLPLIGLPGHGNVLTSLEGFWAVLSNPAAQGLGGHALIIGATTLLTIYLFPRLTKKVPATLAGLLAGTGLALWFQWPIPTIPPIPEGLPVFQWPAISHLIDIQHVIGIALTLAMLGSVDSLLTSVVMDKMTGTRHNSNLELLGQGVGNMVSALIQGLPGAGATMRSVVNIKAGGRSHLSGMVHGVILLFILLGLGQYVAMIPISCLSGILVSVGLSIIDWRGLKRMGKTPRSDVAVMLTVLFLTVFYDLIVAVGIGIAMASILFVKNLSDSGHSEHGELDKWFDKWFKGRDDLIDDALKHAVYVYQFNGPLFFGEAKNFSETLPTLRRYRYIILHFATVPMMDQTGIYALEDAITALKHQGHIIYFVNLKPSCLQMLLKFHVFNHLHLGTETIQTFEQAVWDIKSRMAPIQPDCPHPLI